MMIQKINPRIITYKKAFQSMCRNQFYGHPHGCPNYGKKAGCPPGAKMINTLFDLEDNYNNFFLIWVDYNVGAFANKMKKRHPNWTERQCYNPRLWQPTARKMLREEQTIAVAKYKLETIITSPEAHGINVTQLMKDTAGINLEWPPRDITRVVALGGTRIGGHYSGLFSSA